MKRNQVPSAFKHVFYRLDTEVREDEYSSWTVEVRKACGPSDAIVVSSELEGEPKMHSVMLDINLPCRLIESSTPGHFHLYIDHKLPWRRYRRLLRALSRAGIIEPGYYGISVKRRATHLRPPWKEKS